MLENPGDATLTAILAACPLHAQVTDNVTYCGQWRDGDPQTEAAWFHLIGSGECWVEMRGLRERLHLRAGDFIIFPQGSAHTLCGKAGARSDDFTTMICGELHFAPNARNPLRDGLPEVVVVREADAGAEFRHLGELLCKECHRKEPGSQAVLDKLAEALFAMALRQFLMSGSERRGLLAALADPRLAKALAAMHAQPGRDWTVAELAGIAAMSRTAFAEQFAAVVGESPIHHLTRWRMLQAQKLLADPRKSVTAVAQELGYQTEAAFRRRYKEVLGHGPGQTRRAARTARRA
jgi:AraC-like DNA-binding protein